MFQILISQGFTDIQDGHLKFNYFYNMIVFLIGFMGCGKSKKGRKLASLLGFRYIDMDEYIETNQGQTITQLFERLGEEQFRKIEHEALLSLCKNQQTVIATGGGAPCYFDGIERMNLVGKTVYLKGNSEFLRERLLLSKKVRPLLQILSTDELLPFIKQKLSEREPYYNKAQIVVDALSCKSKDIAAMLKE